MTPRQPLYPVPYAYSLVQGAKLIGDLPITPRFYTANSSNFGGVGKYGYASANSSVNYGVMGAADSPAGAAGYFINNISDGATVKTAGSGIIQSSAPTYLFIPGSAFVLNSSGDTNRWDMNGGTVKFDYGSSGSDTRHVEFPITIPGVLSSQNVKVSEVRIYYGCEDPDSNIAQSILSRSKNSATPQFLFQDTTTRDSDRFTSYAPAISSATATLSADSGPLSLSLSFNFDNASDYIQINVIRVTLEHD